MERILEAPKWSMSNMMHNPEKELAVYYQKQSFGSVQACNFIKKYTLAQVFNCEIWKNFKKTYFHRIPPVAAFLLYKILDFLQDLLRTKNLFKISCPLLFISFVRFIIWESSFSLLSDSEISTNPKNIDTTNHLDWH